MTVTWSPESVKRHRDLWTFALRARRARQLTGMLRRHGMFDVWGVAEDLYALERNRPERWVRRPHGVYAVRRHDRSQSSMIPSPEVLSWLGLRPGGWVTPRDGAPPQTLTSLNDTGTSFVELADLIDRQPLSWTGELPPRGPVDGTRLVPVVGTVGR